MKPSRVALGLVPVYLVLLAVGWVVVSQRGSTPWPRRDPARWVAARDLPALAQLDSADLAPPRDTAGRELPARSSLVGRHLLRAIPRASSVSDRDVAPLTVGTPAPGRVRFVLAARPGEVLTLGLARPGDRLSPCVEVAGAGGAAEWDCGGPPLTVVLLHRRPGAPDSLWAVLETASAADAARFAGAANRLLVRAGEPGPPSGPDAAPAGGPAAPATPRRRTGAARPAPPGGRPGSGTTPAA